MEEKRILESWKEISDYLKHSIKTCQRWEKEFGLPVHRFDETAKGRVFADKAELDVWVKEKLRLAETSEKGLPLFRSLAVLPMRNLCGDQEKDYFSDGMTEALITELGQISAFRVISHQSVRQFQGTGKTIAEIAKMLRVEALVEGALLQAGDRVRLSINFVGAFPERHIWSQTYECGESDVAGLQRRIARTVAEQAGVELTPQVEAWLSSSQSGQSGGIRGLSQGKGFCSEVFSEGRY
jgi:TolB-like protein